VGTPAQMPPAGVALGSNPQQSLGYAAKATRQQASMLRQTADVWARNASSRNYRNDQFTMDFRTMQLQMLTLRERFNWMAAWVIETKKPYANNALSELDAGLNLIGELLVFLDQQFSAGQLDQATLVRTARAFDDAMGEWEAELKKSCSRMGVLL
jgi:hypothetical protein